MLWIPLEGQRAFEAIYNARVVLKILRKIWSSKYITKIRIFNSTMKQVMLYGCETWRTTKQTTHRQDIKHLVERKYNNVDLWKRTRPHRKEKVELDWPMHPRGAKGLVSMCMCMCMYMYMYMYMYMCMCMCMHTQVCVCVCVCVYVCVYILYIYILYIYIYIHT